MSEKIRLLAPAEQHVYRNTIGDADIIWGTHRDKYNKPWRPNCRNLNLADTLRHHRDTEVIIHA